MTAGSHSTVSIASIGSLSRMDGELIAARRTPRTWSLWRRSEASRRVRCCSPRPPPRRPCRRYPPPGEDTEIRRPLLSHLLCALRQVNDTMPTKRTAWMKPGSFYDRQLVDDELYECGAIQSRCAHCCTLGQLSQRNGAPRHPGVHFGGPRIRRCRRRSCASPEGARETLQEDPG